MSRSDSDHRIIPTSSLRFDIVLRHAQRDPRVNPGAIHTPLFDKRLYRGLPQCWHCGTDRQSEDDRAGVTQRDGLNESIP